MAKVIYPITWLAGREGEAADVIHDIAAEMMEHRADLLRHATGITGGDSLTYLNQAHLLEEYATVLDAIYFQLEPERWNPETTGDMIKLAQVHNIALPDWMVPDQKNSKKTQEREQVKETTEEAINRYENEGGRISNPPNIFHQKFQRRHKNAQAEDKPETAE